MPQKIIIAIDGLASSGKSTLAKQLTEALNYKYIDSGAFYRAVTLYFHQNGVDWNNESELQQALENIGLSFEYDLDKRQTNMFMNGKNAEPLIRNMIISELVSEISAIPLVRKFVNFNLRGAAIKKGMIIDGRDIGTVVFPEAELKIFMTADTKIRTERRFQELIKKGDNVTEDQITQNLSGRDLFDSTRPTDPLKKADDALELDTTMLTEEEQLDYALRMALRKIRE